MSDVNDVAITEPLYATVGEDEVNDRLEVSHNMAERALAGSGLSYSLRSIRSSIFTGFKFDMRKTHTVDGSAGTETISHISWVCM